MARDKAMFSKSVTDSDSFVFDLSHDAQALYFHLQGEADADGFLISRRGVTSKYGFDSAAFDELVEAGCLLEFDGGYLVDDWWVHNNFAASHYHEGPHAEAIRSEFYDIRDVKRQITGPARAYTRLRAARVQYEDSTGTAINQAKPSQTKLNEEKEEEGKGKGSGEGESTIRDTCPECGKPCLSSPDPAGGTVFDCTECGMVTVTAAGEIVNLGRDAG